MRDDQRGGFLGPEGGVATAVLGHHGVSGCCGCLLVVVFLLSFSATAVLGRHGVGGGCGCSIAMVVFVDRVFVVVFCHSCTRTSRDALWLWPVLIVVVSLGLHFVIFWQQWRRQRQGRNESSRFPLLGIPSASIIVFLATAAVVNLCPGSSTYKAKNIYISLPPPPAISFTNRLRISRNDLSRLPRRVGFGSSTGLLSPGNRPLSEIVMAKIDEEVQVRRDMSATRGLLVGCRDLRQGIDLLCCTKLSRRPGGVREALQSFI